MKITIEIPDRAAPELLSFLSRMMPVNKSIMPELINADPAPGHPEFKLDHSKPCLFPSGKGDTCDHCKHPQSAHGKTVFETIHTGRSNHHEKTWKEANPIPEDVTTTDQSPPFVKSFEPWNDGGEDLSGMEYPDAEPEDPTMREVPIPEDAPPLPPLPEGKTRWVGRGGFDDTTIPTGARIVYFLTTIRWLETIAFSTKMFHIEAV